MLLMDTHQDYFLVPQVVTCTDYSNTRALKLEFVLKNTSAAQSIFKQTWLFPKTALRSNSCKCHHHHSYHQTHESFCVSMQIENPFIIVHFTLQMPILRRCPVSTTATNNHLSKQNSEKMVQKKLSGRHLPPPPFMFLIFC